MVGHSGGLLSLKLSTRFTVVPIIEKATSDTVFTSQLVIICLYLWRRRRASVTKKNDCDGLDEINNEMVSIPRDREVKVEGLLGTLVFYYSPR